MAAFEVLTVFTGIAVALFVSVNGQTLQQLTSGGSGAPTFTEGTDTTIPIVCSLDVIDTADTTCVLAVMGMTDAEFGYDIPELTSTCTISAGQLSSTVTLQYIDDAKEEPSEAISLICMGEAAPPIIITLNDDDAGKMGRARLTKGSYTFTESSPAATVTLTIEYVDELEKKVNAEEDLTAVFSFAYPKSSTQDTAFDTVDFAPSTTFTAIPVGNMLNMDGSALTGLEVEYVITDDGDLENLKRHFIQLSGAGTYMTASTDLSEIRIADDDLPAVYALKDGSPISRRSKQDVCVVVFTKEMNNDIAMTSVPYTPKDCIQTPLPVYDGIKFSFAKPSVRSRTRFNEYLFTTTETIGTPSADYPLTTSIDISATSHTRSAAPIETSNGPTVTVYPSLDGCTDDALSSRVEVVAPYALSFSRQLRWFFYPANDPTTEVRRSRYNGKSSFYITKCSEVGIYRLCRAPRCKRGWYDFVRVIQAECPEGYQYTDPATATCVTSPTPVVCINGGTFAPITGVCICPPGFAGVTCEIALLPGQFGSSAEFRVETFFPGNTRGKGICLCQNDPGGCSCFAGFGGNDCMKECPPGSFGAGCAFTCHCVDDHCDPFSGVCANGCAPGYSGTNCQD